MTAPLTESKTEHKVMVDGDRLRNLAITCRRNGKQDAWIDIALEWIAHAEPEIARLRSDNKLLSDLIDTVINIPNMSDAQLEELRQNCIVAKGVGNG